MKRRNSTTAGTLWVISNHMPGSWERSRPSVSRAVVRKAAVAAADSPTPRGQACGTGSSWGGGIAERGPQETGFGSAGLLLATSCPAPPHACQGVHGTGPADPLASPARPSSSVTVHATVPTRLPAAASASPARLPLPDAPSIVFLVPLEFRALWNPSQGHVLLSQKPDSPRALLS